MPRIPLFPTENMTDEQRRVHEAIVSGPRGVIVGPLRAALHNPQLADQWQRFGAFMRYGTSLAPRLSELVILTTGRYWDCQVEWYSHEPLARKSGLSDKVIAALKIDERPVFVNADEAAVYDYCLDLCRSHRVSDTHYARALDLFGATGVVELTALIGYYSMVVMTLNAHEIPVPAGVTPPLAPRG
ncbi:MAG: carboxymuconolactone decarboxylase family protein [Pseudomonadota bacterium]